MKTKKYAVCQISHAIVPAEKLKNVIVEIRDSNRHRSEIKFLDAYDTSLLRARGYKYCEACGVWRKPTYYSLTIDGHWYCDNDCMNEHDTPYILCDCCEEIYERDECEPIHIDSDYHFCSVECATDSGFFQCKQCGEWEHEDNAIYCEDNSSIYCSETCANNAGVYQCDDCRQWHTDCICDGINAVCQDCYEDSWYLCENCGYLVHEDDALFGSDGYAYCPDCYEEGAEEFIHRYGYNDDIVFFGDDCDREFPYLGVELETDRATSDNKAAYARALCESGFSRRYWLTEDSSLSNGVEIGAQPMTLGEHISCGLWDEIRHIAMEHGYTSHNAGSCGLHVHINRNFFGETNMSQLIGGYNLAMLISRFETEMTRFARRTDNRWCRYSLHEEFLSGAAAAKPIHRKAAKMNSDYRNSHAICVNFEHPDTFEIRIFRGTLNLDTLYATLEFAHCLAMIAKNKSHTFCQACTWGELLDAVSEYQLADGYLDSYLEKRNLI